MPTYEYTCRDCGHTFDIVQSMWDEALTMCPECGGSLRKVFAPPAISFKGSGFYATDHGKKSKSATAESKSDGETKAAEKEQSAKKADTAASADGSKSSGEDASGGAAAKPSKPAKKEPAPS
jgi:putative FmdB family regulatory protein